MCEAHRALYVRYIRTHHYYYYYYLSLKKSLQEYSLGKEPKNQFSKMTAITECEILYSW